MAQSLENIISGIVRERFPGGIIDKVTVEPDEDNDGDPILRITVVFDSSIGDLEADKMVSLPRHVHHEIIDHKDAAFPIFRFISKQDYDDDLNHEAA